LKDTYTTTVDRASAYEMLQGRASASAAAKPGGGSVFDTVKDSLGGLLSGSGRKDSLVEAAAKSAARTVGSSIGREIVRGVLGSLLGKKR